MKLGSTEYLQCAWPTRIYGTESHRSPLLCAAVIYTRLSTVLENTQVTRSYHFVLWFSNKKITGSLIKKIDR